MNTADTAAAFEVLCSYPEDYLRSEREDLIRRIAYFLRGSEYLKAADPSDVPEAKSFEVPAMVLIRDEVQALGVKGPAAHVLAARIVLDSLWATVDA